MLTTKLLIPLSLLLAFGVALEDGDQLVFKTHGSFYNAKYQYLNASTVSGSIGMTAGYDVKTNLGARFIAHFI